MPRAALRDYAAGVLRDTGPIRRWLADHLSKW